MQDRGWKILTTLLAVLMTLQAFGNIPTDSVKVYFRVGQRAFDPNLRNNRAVMDSLVNIVCQAKADDNLKRIVVSGYASPDGVSTANERLSRLRCEHIADYIEQHTDVSRNIIETIAGGIAWDELRRMVAENQEVPQRESVLKILDNTPVWVFNREGQITSGRKAQLMSLSRGEPYRWMLSHLFPELRNAVAVSVLFKADVKYPKDDLRHPDADKNCMPDYQNMNEPDYNKFAHGPLIINETNPDAGAGNRPAPSNNPDFTNDTIETNVTTYITENNATDPTHLTANTEYYKDSAEASGSAEAIHRLALKTNLLYDAALLPNLELEWMINRNWSVAVEGDLAWWKDQPKHRYYELAMVSMEGRRWFALRKPWQGFYAGVFAGVGKYDLENKAKGYIGEGAMGGVSIGYMFPIGKCFSLEAGFGAGYMLTRYKEYYPIDGHYVYQRTKSLNYFGPLKLKFAIAWRFLDTNKSKRTTSP